MVVIFYAPSGEAIGFEGKNPQAQSAAAALLRQHPKGADSQTHGGSEAAGVRQTFYH